MRLLLSPARSPHPLDRGVRPIRYLRELSNSLTARRFFSADTWAMAAVYARNLFLNLLVLIPLIAAALLIVHLVAGLTRATTSTSLASTTSRRSMTRAGRSTPAPIRSSTPRSA